MNELIFVALSTFAQGDRRPHQLLEASGFPYRIHSTGKRITTSELLRDGANATVIVAGVEPYDAGTLARLPALRCISRCGVGVDAIDLAVARQKGVAVANTPTVPIAAVAELALSMFLSLSRNLGPQGKLMRGRCWERVSSHLLGGRTVGLFGFGRIGRRVAQLCQAFGAKVIVCDPKIGDEVILHAGVSRVERDVLLQTADIVSLHASKDPKHPVLIGSREIALMKPGAILVNLARGDMVDESVLIEALRSGHLAGAGLDVFSTEPYQGPLCDFDQVVLTPHSATMPIETRVEMEMQCIEHAIQFLRGELAPECRVV